MIRLLAVVSARASYARVKTVLKSLSKSSEVDLRVALIASASSNRYGDLIGQIQRDGIKVQVRLDTQVDATLDSSMAKTTALSILSLVDYIQFEDISGILVIADRHETLAGTVAGAYLGKTVFHLQGGERTGNIDDKVRFANSFLSDFHFVATSASAQRLKNAGINQDRIFLTGCPSLDIVAEIDIKGVPGLELSGVGARTQELFAENFIVVLQHAETTSKLSVKDQILPTVNAIESLGRPTLWIWPNADRGSEDIVKEIRKCRELGGLKHVHFEKTIKSSDFLAILKQSSCVVGNSSVAIREGSFLGTPAVNIGGRQQGREFGANVISVGFDEDSIVKAISKQIKSGRFPTDNLYGDGKAGKRIADTIIHLAGGRQ